MIFYCSIAVCYLILYFDYINCQNIYMAGIKCYSPFTWTDFLKIGYSILVKKWQTISSDIIVLARDRGFGSSGFLDFFLRNSFCLDFTDGTSVPQLTLTARWLCRRHLTAKTGRCYVVKRLLANFSDFPGIRTIFSGFFIMAVKIRSFLRYNAL